MTAAALSACASSEALPEPTVLVGSDVFLTPDVHTISARVARGATLASLLRAHEIAEAEVSALVARVSTVFDLRRLRVDRPYRIARALTGELRRFEYEIDGDRLLQVTRSRVDGAFAADVVTIEKTARQAVVHSAIDRDAPSLFAAMSRSGETVNLSLKLANIFAGDVDFNSDLQPGDRFDLVVDKLYREDDAFGGYGPILGASLDNRGRQLWAIRFTPEGESPGYFDQGGRSLRRFFLRTPLRFEPVVTSRFSLRRLHPVLHEYRPHLGVDYRAPEGAPVVAVANGVVRSAGWNGSAGRLVHLRHANGFETQYLHLSSITVKRGARIRQGDLIGRVGSTGLATGPHLDYRLKKNGRFVDPVAAHRAMPPGEPIPADQLAAFEAARDRLLTTLSAPEPFGN